MLQITNWTYNDIALYAKGWYERKDLFKDMSHIFCKIYGYMPDNMHDIAHMMLLALDSISEHLEPGEKVWWDSYARVFEDVDHRVDFYNMDRDTAIVSTVLSIVMGLERKDIAMKKPVYGKKEYFRSSPGLFASEEDVRKNRTKTYAQMNREAEKYFEKEGKA